MTAPIIPDLSRLKRRLAAVLAAAAVLLTAVSALYYSHYRDSLRADAERLLLSTGQIKLDQLLNWRKERLSDALLLAESPVFTSYASRLASGASGTEAAGLARRRLEAYLKYKRYPYAALADRNGKVLVCAGKKTEAICPQFKNLVPAAMAAGRPQMGDFYLSDEDLSPHIDIVTPVGGGSGLLLLLRVNPADYLYPMLQAWSAKGETGEILLVTRDGDDVLFLNDLRHVRGAAMRLRLPVGDPDLPAAMGLKGYKGVLVGTDYRGVKVLAAVSPVEGTNWALVTKVDWREVMQGSFSVGALLALLLLALLSAAVAVAFLLFKRQAEVYENSYSEHLSRLNERLTLAARAGRLGIWDWDVKANVLTWDDGMYALYGIKREDFKGAYEAWLSAIHPEDKARGDEETRLALSGEKPFDTEFRVRLPDGSVRHIKADATIYRDADGKPVRMLGVNHDVTARRRDDGVNGARARLLQYATDHSIDELLEETLNEAEKLTDSSIGFYHFVDEDRKSLTLQNWSTATKRRFCKAEGKGAHYDIAKAGVWVECFYKREPVIHNDYAALPDKKGLPEGHAAVVRELVVPVLRGGKIRAILGVGNKAALYDADDVRVVSLLADLAWEIAERKMAEDALRQSNRLMERTQGLARIGGWEWDLDKQTMHWTEEMYRLHGMAPDAISSGSQAHISESQKCYRPEDLPVVMAAFNKCVSEGEPYDLEFRFTALDGRGMWVRTTARAERRGGRVVKVIGTLADITERKAAEEDVLALARQRQLALDAASLGWWRYVPATKMSYYDDRYKEIFEVTGSGQPNEEILKRLHPDDLPGVWARVEAALDPAKRESYAAEYRINLPDGRIKWVEAHGIAIFDAAGPRARALELVGTVADITGRRQMEQALARSEEQFRSMFEMHSAVMLLISPETGRILDANLAAERFYGHARDRLKEMRISDINIAPRDEISDVLKGVDTGGRTHFEARHRLADGGVRVVDVHASSVTTSSGHVNFAVIHDITDKKEAEQRIAKLNRDLQAKNQEMENFLYITTHDLRSPLVNIQGFSQNIERYLKELQAALGGLPVAPEEKTAIAKLAGEKMPAALEYVLSGSRKMDALITALLKVSRAGRVDMRPEKVDAGEVLKKVADAMRFQLQQCGAELKPGALPPCWADPGAVSQVFSNLVDNAVKYRAEGRAPVIEVSGERNGDRVTYRVSDNGPGIPAKDLDRIWNVFYSHERAGARKGEGIGLPMVKRLVEKNNGAIKAESADGRGLAFIIELPAGEGK